MHHLHMVRRDLAAQMEANERLAGQWKTAIPATAVSSQQVAAQHSALPELRKLAANIECEVLKGMEAEVGLQLPLAKIG